jgi:hypothetical protein
MNLTGPACTEALSGAEEARNREGAGGNAGGVRVGRRVRPLFELEWNIFIFFWRFLFFIVFIKSC